jgi:hypothetical protein
MLEPFPVAVTIRVNAPVGVPARVDEPPPPWQEIIAPDNVNVPMIINIPPQTDAFENTRPPFQSWSPETTAILDEFG